jgi:dynein heavy chain
MYIYKYRDVPVLKAFGVVIEELEEAQLQIQTLLSIRHVAPFRSDVQRFLTQLSGIYICIYIYIYICMYIYIYIPMYIHI